MPNMEIPYAEILTVARYMMKADQCVTSCQAAWTWTSRGKCIWLSIYMLLFNMHEQARYDCLL